MYSPELYNCYFIVVSFLVNFNNILSQNIGINTPYRLNNVTSDNVTLRTHCM